LRTFTAPTLTELHQDLCHTIVHAPAEKLDVITTVDVQIHNAMAMADSMAWEFDLKDMWLTPARWTMMCNQYINPADLRIWLNQCIEKIGTRGRGIAMMRTNTVKARGGPAQGNKETRRWGSCMLAISYKAKPAPQITLYSRTSYLGYLGALDLSVAWMCGKYLAHGLGIDVAELKFLWYNEALQYHNFKSLAFLLNHPNEDEREFYRKYLMKKKLKEKFLERNTTPALKLSRVWLQRLIASDAAGETLGDMSYNTYRRIRRRFHTEVMGYDYAKQFEGWSVYKKPMAGHKVGEQKEFFKAYQPLPHTPVDTLSFSRLGLRFDESFGEVYDGEGDDESEENEED